MARPPIRPSSSASSGGSFSPSITDSESIPLRIFLIQTAKGLFSSSGGYKANLSFLRYLASRGHSVRQICYSHRGEVETYIQSLAKGSGWDPRLRRRQLHLRAEDGRTGIDISIQGLVMEDGVQIVSLDKEAFDEAFGGQEKSLKTMPKETANYIEVIDYMAHSSVDLSCANDIR